MEGAMTTRRAACSCGQLGVEVSGEPMRISICHCLDCQRRTGNVFGTQARFRLNDATISGRSTSFERVADSGNRIVFHFCPTCGSTVYYLPEAEADTIAVPVGAFADPDFPAPRVSVYETRRHPWVAVSEDIEHFD
jgi:hypothetical protein